MEILTEFTFRPASSSFIFGGECFIKVGKESKHEAELLLAAKHCAPKLYAYSECAIIMQRGSTYENVFFRIETHARLLRKLHDSKIEIPDWRNCTVQEYVEYCCFPKSESIPNNAYDLFTYLAKSQMDPEKTVFVHGDATLSNSVGDFFVDFSVRPTVGDALQDWSKFLFSILGFDIEYNESFFIWFQHQPEVKGHFNSGRICSSSLAFYFLSNLLRVLRKQEISVEVMERCHEVLHLYLH